MSFFRDFTRRELEAGDGALLSRLEETWAIRVTRAWDEAECAAAAEAVLAARGDWVADFKGTQFTLGRAWYAHLEQARARAYFAEAAAADAAVERALPGMQARMRATMGAFVGEPVLARRGWCGAGVHVFPAGEKVSRAGGDLHFDEEGFTEAVLRDRPPALSFVLMLQPPERGGAIRIWDALYEGSAIPTRAQLDRPYVDVSYGAGDLVVFSSYRLHHIQPFEGSRDRISVTVHAARLAGEWVSWF
jgi:hypothetical protein